MAEPSAEPTPPPSAAAAAGAPDAAAGGGKDEAHEGMGREARIRMCDLLQAQERLIEAQQCWEAGVRQYPDMMLMYNELGNVHAQLGSLEVSLASARSSRVSVGRGSRVS